MLNVSFAGRQTANDQARLEAFIHQARAYDAKTGGGKPAPVGQFAG
jgi:hypothetical protein